LVDLASASYKGFSRHSLISQIKTCNVSTAIKLYRRSLKTATHQGKELLLFDYIQGSL